MIDGAWNHAGYLVGDRLVFTEDVREGGAKRCCALDGTKVDFANIRANFSQLLINWEGTSEIPVVESKDCSSDIQCDVLRDSGHIAVECSSHIVVVAENESLLGVESYGNDILCVILRVLCDILNCSLWAAEDVFLIVCQHDD